jgi:hypothetical protein
MKNFIIIYLLFVFNICVNSQELKTLSDLKFGIERPNLNFNYNYFPFDYCFFGNMLYSFEYKNFNLIFENETKFIKGYNHTFKPLIIDYKIDFNKSYKKIEFGYQHQCTHSIISNNDFLHYQYSNDRLYIKIKLK